MSRDSALSGLATMCSEITMRHTSMKSLSTLMLNAGMNKSVFPPSLRSAASYWRSSVASWDISITKIDTKSSLEQTLAILVFKL